MTPTKQRFGHDPDNNIYGDCFPAVVASMLDVDLDKIPHIFDNGKEGLEAWQVFDDWLEDYGLQYVSIPFDISSWRELKKLTEIRFPGLYLEVMGKSSGGNFNHSVVMKDGEIVHNPAESEIVGPALDGYYWIGLFISLKVHGKRSLKT